MIEILGAGVADTGGAWVFRRLCARIESPSFVGVVSTDGMVRSALFDIVTGARIADEGRVWVDRMPVMADTRRRLQSRVADLRRPGRARSRQVRATQDRGASIRLEVSAAVARGQTHVILPDLDGLLEAVDRTALVEVARNLVRASCVSVFVGATDPEPLRGVADRILIFARTSSERQRVS